MIYSNLSSTILIFTCIDEILRAHNEKIGSIFTINTDYSSQIPTVQFNFPLNLKYYPLIKPEVYVIDSTDNEITEVLKSLEFRTLFNPTAMVILIVSVIDCDILMFLEKYFVYKLIFLKTTPSNTMYLYGCEQFIELLNVTKVVENSHCEERALIQNLPRSTRDWTNFTITVGVGNSPPYGIRENLNDSYTDMDIDIVEIIAKKMKFSVIYVPSKNFVGTKVNSSYNGALGMVAEKSVDMVMGGMFATKDSCLDFSISQPIHQTTYSWYVPGPMAIPFWKRILLIYQPSVSLAVFLFYLLMTFLQITFNHLFLKGRRRFYNEFFKLWASASSAPIRVSQREGCSKRMFYICWFMFWLIFNACFASKLLECLIKKKYNFPISSLEGLEKAELEICILKGLEVSLEGFKDKIITCTECEECLKRTAFKKDLVTVRNTDLVNFYQSHYLSPNGDPLIHALKEKYFAIYNVMIFRKNHPLFDEFNTMLRRMIASGICAHVRGKYKSFQEKTNLVKEWKSLELHPLKFLFHFWSYGLALSIAVFLCELIIIKCESQTLPM